MDQGKLTEDQKYERGRAAAREQAWAEAVARVWRGDVEFRERLMNDPKEALRELGAEFSEGVIVKVVENNEEEMVFTIPVRPRELEDLIDENILKLYGACPCTVCAVPDPH